MTFRKPALAAPLDDLDPVDGEWVAEEKYDGHRLVVEVSDRQTNLLSSRTVTAWSRYGLERSLEPHVREALELAPEGTYDGELYVPGKRSYGVTELINGPNLVYVVFDVLELLGRDTTSLTYLERRRALLEIFQRRCFDPNHNGDRGGQPNNRGCGNSTCFNFIGNSELQPLRLSEAVPVMSLAHLKQLSRAAWGQDKEGLIVKRAASTYAVGKRTKDWRKVKQLRSEVLTVVGFRAGKMGPHSTVVLRNAQGFETVVKWKNYEELDKLDSNPDAAIGRRLRIEFQERTPDGSYRHPRWDRWEDE